MAIGLADVFSAARVDIGTSMTCSHVIHSHVENNQVEPESVWKTALNRVSIKAGVATPTGFGPCDEERRLCLRGGSELSALFTCAFKFIHKLVGLL